MSVTPYLTPFEFGAVGDLSTDDTAAIQACINAAVSSGVKNIYLGTHKITDLNLTNINGITLYSINRKRATSSTICNLFISGSTSQGIDISGSSNMCFNDISINGDTTTGSIPRCAIFGQRTNVSSVDNVCANNNFTNLTIEGKFANAAVYNYGGKSWIFDKCRFNISSGTVFYFTSKNTSAVISRTATASTGTSHETSDIIISNCSIIKTDTATQAILAEGGMVSTLLDTNNPVSKIKIRDTYFKCTSITPIVLTYVTGDVIIDGVNDESTYSTTNFCKIISGSSSAPLTTLSIANSNIPVTTTRAILVQGTGGLRNFNDLGGNTLGTGGKII